MVASWPSADPAVPVRLAERTAEVHRALPQAHREHTAGVGGAREPRVWLQDGDEVVLASGATAPVKWIGRRRLDPHLDAFKALGASIEHGRDILLTAPGGLTACDFLMDEPSVMATENALMAAALALDEGDLERSLEHARFARSRAARVGIVRELAGVIAYQAGEWSEALAELRTARRLGGGPGQLALMADSERGLGRPERALELALDGGEGQGRRALTLVPDYHLCVVRADQVVETVPQAVRRLAQAVADGVPIPFGSRPAAASDLVVSRVAGVHGPRTLDVILVGSPSLPGTSAILPLP